MAIDNDFNHHNNTAPTELLAYDSDDQSSFPDSTPPSSPVIKG